jgi:GTP-dependent phosphoenolpyruvate carboxykinase
MNTEAMARYTDRIFSLHEQIQNITEQDKQAMCDRKFFSGKDYELLMLVQEYYKWQEGITIPEGIYITDEEKKILQNISVTDLMMI